MTELISFELPFLPKSVKKLYLRLFHYSPDDLNIQYEKQHNK